jgi:ectoine hydroxylase-related dioxygenase (phytanoyl-CoA dioxygenase family)
MLTSEEIKKYKEDGYLIPIFQMDEKDLLEIEELHNSLVEKFPKFRNYCPAVLLHDERFLKYCFNKKILNIIEQLIGKNFALWNSSFFAKPALNGHATPWHQDGQYWPIRPLSTCSVWLAVDDATSENGCLKFIKGSHKDKKLKKHKINKSEKLTLNQELLKSEFLEKNSVDLILKRGQISLHDVYMVHGSEENKSSKSRRAMTMRFMPTTSIFDHRFVFNTRDFSITKIYQAKGKDVSMKNNIIPLDVKNT